MKSFRTKVVSLFALIFWTLTAEAQVLTPETVILDVLYSETECYDCLLNISESFSEQQCGSPYYIHYFGFRKCIQACEAAGNTWAANELAGFCNNYINLQVDPFRFLFGAANTLLGADCAPDAEFYGMFREKGKVVGASGGRTAFCDAIPACSPRGGRRGIPSTLLARTEYSLKEIGEPCSVAYYCSYGCKRAP